MYPVITWWLHLKRKQHKNQWVLCEKTLVSFTILFTMYPLQIWATHWDFFHKILCNVITMSPEVSLQRNHTVAQFCHKLSKNSQWVAQIWSGYIVNKIVKETRVLFHKEPSGFCAVFFSNVITIWLLGIWWSKWGFLFKKTQHVPRGFLLSEVLKKS